jgi:hypothetical protein
MENCSFNFKRKPAAAKSIIVDKPYLFFLNQFAQRGNFFLFHNVDLDFFVRKGSFFFVKAFKVPK